MHEPKFLMRVWDAPTRLFHWGLTVLVAICWITGQTGRMDWHVRSAYAVAALLIFRLVWGFIGSDTARFSGFLRSPLAGLAHLRHIARREPDLEIGHNAAGGWMVLIILLVLAAQVGTGLFANDDIFTQGPLAHDVAKSVSDRISGLHRLLAKLVLGVAALHVLAVVAYALLKRQDLVRPMVTGRKRLPGAMRAPRMASPLLALAVLAAAAVLVYAVATFA